MAEPKLVLVVDDDAETRTLLGSIVARQGLTVDFASDGGTAIDLIGRRPYSVILLDLLLPGTDGFAVLDALSQPGMPNPVVLVITGADRSVVDRLDSRRIHGIVRKPFDPQELAGIIAACVEIKARGTFGTMAIATMLAGGPILEFLNRFAK